ncbi:hypothetical protein T4D_4484 [Trichinella pseudospiralis]|uniref:Uncharacterized protein n=1 Tax=Trichinella pseudospiralis TaxID=6337 RepID=A0A0V1DLH8_TRIPS|nr:hypothetical protein T4D_4484 [Trichinella pseudospiralis]
MLDHYIFDKFNSDISFRIITSNSIVISEFLNLQDILILRKIV